MAKYRVAIAHDYLTQRGGAERVVLAMARAFPDAPIYTALYHPALTYPEFASRDVRPSWLNKVPALRRFHRIALPLLAAAVSTTKIDADYLLVSSSGWAHGFKTGGVKVVYCHSPARWLYQADAYVGTQKRNTLKVVLSLLSPLLLRWDKRQARTATKYLANSTVVKQRILEAYGIEADVVPAPHSVEIDLPQEPVNLGSSGNWDSRFYLCISRLLPYKNVDVIIEALRPLGAPLVIVGAGPEEKRLRSLADDSVIMLKDVPDSQLRWLYANCTALLSASYEDYGLTPIEAAAFGKPAIVLRWGGFLDTIHEGVSGIYFDEPTAESARAAVLASRNIHWNPDKIRAHSQRFSEEAFASKLMLHMKTSESKSNCEE